MPVWLQVIIGAAALVTAIGVLWKKVISPGARLVHTMELMLPLLNKLLDAFKDSPDGAFKVLQEIAKEFRTDSGSSLRDLANRLEATAKINQTNIEILKSGLDVLRIAYEATKQVETIGRDKIQELAVSIALLRLKVEEGTASGLRMEENAAVIAGNLAIAQEAVDGVKDDLAAAHKRADETHHTAPAGTAADAAAQQTVREKIEDEKG